jgi:hypothetical protein
MISLVELAVACIFAKSQVGALLAYSAFVVYF